MDDRKNAQPKNEERIVAFLHEENSIFVIGYGKFINEVPKPDLPEVGIEEAKHIINIVDSYLDTNLIKNQYNFTIYDHFPQKIRKELCNKAIKEHNRKISESLDTRAKKLLERTNKTIGVKLESGEVIWEGDCLWEYASDFEKKYSNSKIIKIR